MRTLRTLRLTVAAVAGVVIVGGGTVAARALRDEPLKPITPSGPAESSVVTTTPATTVAVTTTPVTATVTTTRAAAASTTASTAPATATLPTIGSGSTTSIRVILTPG